MAGKKSFEQYGRGLADSSLTSLESSWENLRQLSKDFESDQNSSNCVLNHSAANVLTNRLAGTHLESTGRKRKKPIKRDLITSFQQYANHSNDGEQEQMNFQIYSDSSDDDQDQRKKSNKRLNNNSRLRNEKDDVVIQRLIQNVSAKGKSYFCDNWFDHLVLAILHSTHKRFFYCSETSTDESF